MTSQTRIPNERDKVNAEVRVILNKHIAHLTSTEMVDVVKDITAFCMDYSYKDWAATERHGIALGHRDAVTMLKALADKKQTYCKLHESKASKHIEDVEAIPLDELQKVITALRSVSMEDISNV